MSGIKIVEAVGIEHRAVHLVWTILQRFRGQVPIRTRPKNTKKTRSRTFLWQCHKSRCPRFRASSPKCGRCTRCSGLQSVNAS